jgi:glycosyltransferase involved in cell wall biosynthesis
MRKILMVGDDPDGGTGFGLVNSHIREVIEDGNADILYLCWNMANSRRVVIKNGIIQRGYFALPPMQFVGPQIETAVNVFNPDIIIFHNDINYLYNLLYVQLPSFGKAFADSFKDRKLIWVGPMDSLIATDYDKKAIDTVDYAFPYTKGGAKRLGTNPENVFRCGPSFEIKSFVRPVNDTKKFLTVGVNREKKHQDTIIKSFLLYHEKNPNSTLTVKTKVESYFTNIIQYNQLDFIHIIDKFISDDEMRELYETHTHYICATPNEGWGIPMTNATHYGMTIIAPDFFVHDESSGGNYVRIPKIDIIEYDGWRHIPNHSIKSIPVLMNTDQPNYEKIDYWDDSKSRFKKAMEEI